MYKVTLLKSKDIFGISENLARYDKILCEKTGKSLAGIAMYAVSRENRDSEPCFKDSLVGVVPVTCGSGIINGFSETVSCIVESIGFKCFITKNKDVSGLEEAYEKKAKVIFIADDDKFIAINTCNNKVAENSFNTGRGYAAALDLMSGGLKDKNVLLIGAGPVGFGAAFFMINRGARILVYDILKQKAESLKKSFPEVEIITDPNRALKNNNLIFDATYAKDIIKKEHVDGNTLISAPGIPLGLREECFPIIKDRLIHDVLEIGVATMLFDSLS
ncbi:3-methylornithyl-N6-L-lysine dehydrogenase PylD [Clostridium sp. JNZ X4-2]